MFENFLRRSTFADLGPRTGDGQAQGVYGSHEGASLLLRSTAGDRSIELSARKCSNCRLQRWQYIFSIQSFLSESPERRRSPFETGCLPPADKNCISSQLKRIFC